MTATNVTTIYRRRFRNEEMFRHTMWAVLCTDFFQRYVPQNSTVLEIGAGYCEFINAIQARYKIAVDLNPDLVHHAASDVEVHIGRSSELSAFATGSVDVAFASNFSDHLTPLDDRGPTEVLETSGFRVVLSIPRFLPYTTKSRFPRATALIRIYLRVPLNWRLFAHQDFVVAEAVG